jgi:hypothetical protein
MQYGWVARQAAGTVGRRLAAKAAPSPDALRDVRADPDWRRVEDGRAARLGPRQTIEVTRRGRWRHTDPLAVEAGWWAPRHASGALLWASAVGLAWWQGRHGRGPLRSLHDPMR